MSQGGVKMNHPNSGKYSLQTRNTLDYGIKAIGRADYQKFADNKRLTRSQAIKAKCYECTCGYSDGKYDCIVFDCPLHKFMPYRGIEPQD